MPPIRSSRLRQYQLEHWKRRRVWRLQNQPLSDAEAEAFAAIGAWISCGGSLSVASMNSDITEPRLAAWVRELQAGRNGQFAESLKEILRVPWHFQGPGYDARPVFYSSECAQLTKWSD
jgi:hypothetical protein